MHQSKVADEIQSAGDVEMAVVEAIEACDGDPVSALRAAIVAVCFLEEQLDRLQRAVSYGYMRGQFYRSLERPVVHPSYARSESMNAENIISLRFIAGFGPIVRDGAASLKLYTENLGISFKEEAGGYLHTEALLGARSFALWPLSQAAQSCFGQAAWPNDIAVPQAWIEFEVDSVEGATTVLEQRGCRMLVKNKTEPWGQTVSRFISPEGLLAAVTFTPMLRE